MLKSDAALVTAGRLMDILLTYRDMKAWDDMIRLIHVWLLIRTFNQHTFNIILIYA